MPARVQLRRIADGIRGTLTVGAKEATVTKANTAGGRLEFEARLPQGSVRKAMWFHGWIEDDTLVGTVRTERPDAPARPWRARRAVADKGA